MPHFARTRSSTLKHAQHLQRQRLAVVALRRLQPIAPKPISRRRIALHVQQVLNQLVHVLGLEDPAEPCPTWCEPERGACFQRGMSLRARQW